ncbi:MAG TPA: FHA domain-containing protein, partial [Kofleriaceae bacterium]|nr:FHA domain-containing protein [Kofleriaceae bacterium]
MLPGGAGPALGDGPEDEDERTTIEPEPPVAPDEAPTPMAAALDEQWEDGTTVAESGEKRLGGSGTIDEPTVEDHGRGLGPGLQLVHGTATGAADPRAAAKLHVVAGSDQGRVFDLRPGKDLQIGRAVDNDVVLTDIAVSRRHLELAWDGEAWILKDRGSGNGTLINDRIEDGKCQLRHGDRIEIGNTVFRFDHPPSATTPSVGGWGQEEEEAATVAGKGGRATSSQPVVDAPRGRATAATASPVAKEGRLAPLPAPRPRRQSGTVDGRPEVPRPPSDPARARSDTRPTGAVATPVSSTGAGPIALPQLLAQAPPVGPITGPVTGSMSAVGAAGSAAMSAAPFGPAARPMTITAHVEPRPFAPYPFIVAPDATRRKHILIGAGVATAIALIGIAAMLAGDDTPPSTTATRPG